jgi:amino acid transporter
VLAATAPPAPPERPSVGVGDAIALGVSSSGPAQTLAVSLASLVAVCGYGGSVALLVCVLPMLGIAIGYRRLNVWRPSAGATYTWVARVFHPSLGFLAGWMILLYYTLGTSSLTIPAGTYTLALIAPQWVDRPWAIAVAGGTWNLAVTVLALIGLRVAARFDWLVVLFQYAVLLALATLGLAMLFLGHTPVHYSSSWFTLEGLGGMRGLVSGILIACFMYSGWDAAIYVNEESADRRNDSGHAAIATVGILAFTYAYTVAGLAPVLSGAELESHAGNSLSVISERLLGPTFGKITSLVVLAGTLATLQAAVLSAARVGRAMARDNCMPRLFLRVDPHTGNPWAATLVMSGINLLLLGVALATGSVGHALNQVVASLGLISLLFYGLTAAAAFWQSRARWRTSAAEFWLGAVLPGLGVLFMIGVFIATVLTDAVPTSVLIYGLGSVAVGVVIALVLQFVARVPFFRGPSPTPESAP